MNSCHLRCVWGRARCLSKELRTEARRALGIGPLVAVTLQGGC